MIDADAQAVLDFWFAPEGNAEHGTLRPLWFRKSDATDREIGERFAPLIERALRGELIGWAADPRSALQDEALRPEQRAFVYLPFEHAEGIAMQDEAVRLFTRLAAEAPLMADMLAWAHKHRDVVQRFGRFPHRNAILGRQSTAEELAFLREPGSRF